MRSLAATAVAFALAAGNALADDSQAPAQFVQSAPKKKSRRANSATPPAGGGEAQTTQSADPPLLHIGDEAPLFRAPLHNSIEAKADQIDLGSLVGDDATDEKSQLVLISFFATWCGPCKRELPLLVQLANDYRPRGVRFISVAIDKNEADWPQIAALVKKYGVTFPVAKDRYNFVARRWLGEKTQLPSLFFVGRDGLIKLVKQGYTTGAEKFLRTELDRALATASYLSPAGGARAP